MGERLLTAREVVEQLRVSHDTVVDWCEAGDLPGAFQLRGRKGAPWRIPESALDANIGNWRSLQSNAAPGRGMRQQASTGAACGPYSLPFSSPASDAARRGETDEEDR